MFKKGRKKSKDNSTKSPSLDQEQSAGNAVASDNTCRAGKDQVEGFDQNGFVDLKSNHSPTLMGPKQPCQYVGTFPVHSGLGFNGENTLESHKARTRFVKEQLVEYKNSKKGVAVQIVVSSDGLKVVTPDGKRVRMAHALQRISFAMCDPDAKLFAYMTHNPSPSGVEILCHVFKTTKVTQVQELTSVVGKAFQRAFAAAKGPAGTKHDAKVGSKVVDPLYDPNQQPKGRRWAKLEAHKSHEDSGHAQMAKARRKKAVAKENSDIRHSRSKSVDEHPSITDGSPVEKRKVPPLNIPNHPNANLEEAYRSTTISPTNNQQMATTTMYAEEPDLRFSRSFSSPNVPHRPLPPTPQSPTPPCSIFNATPDTIDSRSTSSQVSPSNAHEWPSKFRTMSVPSMIECESNKPPKLPPKQHSLPSSLSDQSLELEGMSLDDPLVSPSASSHEVDHALEVNTSDTEKNLIPKQNTARDYRDESWYISDYPREFVMEMLENSEEGSFFVRDSQSRPGCWALTMRVPYEVNESGFGNYLITQEGERFSIQGFSNTFPDLPSLIEYHARVSVDLPCKLALSGSNVLCEDETYMSMSSKDPDYMALSDYRNIYAELTERK